MSKEDYIKLIDNISNFKYDSEIPNDGWILIDKNYQNILKIKPRELLTIDLVFKNDSLQDSIGNKYKYVSCSKKYLKNNKIYRCYYDLDSHCWEPREERFDKFKPNNNKICGYLERYNRHFWKISEIKMLKKVSFLINLK